MFAVFLFTIYIDSWEILNTSSWFRAILNELSMKVCTYSSCETGNGFRRRLVTPWPLKVIGIWPYPDPIWKLFPCIYVYIVYITPTTRTGPVSLPSYRTLTMLHFSSSTILNLFNRNPVYGLSWFTDSNIYIYKYIYCLHYSLQSIHFNKSLQISL